MYDLLTGWSDEDFSPVPQLADSWEKSTDGLTWTFKIHPGVKWSDGQPLTAKDVAYTFNRTINGENERPKYDAYVKNIKDVVALDDLTAEFHLKAADPIMDHLWVPIIPEHIWKDIDSKEVTSFSNEDNPVGSGPFVLAERKPGEFIRLTANKSYFRGGPKIDELVFKIFEDEDAMVQALRKGEIDAVDSLGGTTFQSLQGAAGVTTVQSKGLGFNEIGINVGAQTVDNKPIGDGHPALKDLVVRQAIAYAIDRNALVDRVLRGLGEPGSSIMPPAYADLYYTPGDKEYKFDLAKANSLLDGAGYTRGSDGIRVDPNSGKKLSFRLFGREDSEESKGSVQFVQGWLKEIGIDAKVTIMAEDKLTEVIGAGEFDLFEWGWGVEPDPDFQVSTFTCDQRSYEDSGEVYAGWSDSFYCNQAYDGLYKQQSVQLDRPQRAATIMQMEDMLYTDLPYVVTYYQDNLQAYRSDRWTGLKPDASGAIYFGYGTDRYRSIDHPSEPSDSGGISTGVLIGVGAVVAIGLVAGGIALARSRATEGDRE
jgi:peptide/nickel transport system substrate-binding protein